MNTGILIKTFAVLLVLLAIPLWNPQTTPRAYAGVFDKMERFFQLPGEVEKLQDSYEQVQTNYAEVQKQYESTLEQYEATRQELDAAKETAEQYREEQLRLLEENKRLAEQNRQLSQSVDVLKHSEQQKVKSYNRLRTGIYTVVGLAAAVFLAGRLTRFFMRRKW